MTKSTKIAAALALACAALASQAQAADISNPVEAIEVVDGAGFFGRLITGNHAHDTFTDQYSFNLGTSSSFVADLFSYSGNAKNGLNITGFDLFDAGGTLVSRGAQLASGKTDQWQLSLANLDAGDGYYVTITGSVMSQAAGKYSVGVAAVSAVPEPATYGMLLGGMALLGVAARRRQHVK